MLSYAPDPILVGGVTAVPISIQSVTAVVQCDCVIATATATATIVFSVGLHPGRPIFDLRQTIISARLDGVAIATSDLSHHIFNGDSAARMRVLDRDMAAGSTHILEFDYEIEEPASIVLAAA